MSSHGIVFRRSNQRFVECGCTCVHDSCWMSLHALAREHGHGELGGLMNKHNHARLVMQCKVSNGHAGEEYVDR